MFLVRNFNKFNPVKIEDTNEEGAICIQKEELVGRPNNCIYFDGKHAYISLYGISKEVNAVIEQNARMLECYTQRRDEKEHYNIVRKRMRELLIQNDPHFNKSIKTLKIWDLQHLEIILNHMKKTDYRVKQSTRKEVQTALRACILNPRKEEKFIWVLSRYSQRNERELLDNYRGSKNFVRMANEKQPFLPKGIMKYVKNANKSFYPIRLEDNKRTIASLMTQYYAHIKNVTVDRILEAEGDGYGFKIEETLIHGESISTIAKNIANALKILAYSTRKKCTNGIIEECHMIMGVRKFRGNRRKNCQPLYGGSAKESKCKLKRLKEEIAQIVKGYSVPSQTEFNEMIQTTGIALNVTRDVDLTLKKYNETNFRGNFGNPNTYYPLIPFWHLRAHLPVTITSWEQFVKFMLHNKKAVTWVRLYISASVVAKVFSKEKATKSIYGDDPTIIGSQCDEIMDMFMNIRQQLRGNVRARYISVLLTAVLSYELKCRQPLLKKIYIISEIEFKKRFDIQDMTMLTHGLHIIVHDGYYRIYVKHHKNAHTNGRNIDLEGSQLQKYKYLYPLLDDIVWAYEQLTGHRVKHNNYEPRYYISNFSPSLSEYSGYNRMVKCHTFPLIYPFYENGNRSYMTVRGIPTDATEVYLKGDIEDMIPMDLKKKHINKWTNNKYIESLTDKKVSIIVDGREIQEKLLPMKHAPEAQTAAYTPFSVVKSSGDSIMKSYDILNYILKNIENEIILDKKYFGGEVKFKYKFPISEQLKTMSKECSISFKHLGRYGSDQLKLAALNLLQTELRSVPDVVREVKYQKERIMEAADHTTERIAINSYKPCKSDALHDFSQLIIGKSVLSNEELQIMAERMASHPTIRPTRQSIPDKFIPATITEGELKPRLSDMSRLNAHERAMQIFYLQSVWKVYEVLDDLETKISNPSDLHIAVRKRYDEVMKKAGQIWDKKHGSSVCDCVTRCLKRKKEDNNGSNKKRRL
eukprot:g5207.t1